jgi:hypothetical protein
MNRRLPVGSPAAVRWTWESTRPGMRNLPEASRTWAPGGMATELEGPTAVMCWLAMRTVVSGWGGAPVALMTVAWVMARVGRELEVGLVEQETRSNEVRR